MPAACEGCGWPVPAVACMSGCGVTYCASCFDALENATCPRCDSTTWWPLQAGVGVGPTGERL